MSVREKEGREKQRERDSMPSSMQKKRKRKKGANSGLTFFFLKKETKEIFKQSMKEEREEREKKTESENFLTKTFPQITFKNLTFNLSTIRGNYNLI